MRSCAARHLEAWRDPCKLHVALLVVRAQWHIIVEGDEIPPPIKNFKDMRFPQAMHCSQSIAGLD